MFLSNLTELTLSQGYRQFFKVVPALNDALRAESYRIRHEVYCRELGFEQLRADGLEADDFDDRSVHCLVQSVSTGQYVGCARLVLLDPEHPADRLPVEITCAGTLDRSIVDPMALDRSRIAEISRLAVIGSYRRRRGEQNKPISLSEEDFGTPQRPRQPYLALAVYLGLIALARHYGVQTIFVLTEPRLAMNLSRLGVHLELIGTGVEHRGVRVPSMMSVSEIIDGMNFLVRALFEVISREVKEGLDAAGPDARRANHLPLP
ncbi:MAG TPA: PEP-CTERM/exosortase system-associated acyltransferase [Accumulibacter sp.]|uniref:PEP-CTERM/exosortase system-associated acyltransferase n=1 Tax=Accumulibacter sp. TaxID=2053492 RepID=UPI0025EAA16D|nr:PEP-CTERM/exosortase system-associated acyltransferase [Accumulibacter sp.]MCM8600439.1 PEP-CTERM/exosortase system-associated acyltransferase [Accumulibacter sp.]MCM8664631.1 PEP-CTERM/exosortase system-associated acyltransferase [Accumulibacter sp.]HNC53331.1 PEP-CTERM/exosortase system-associated acyltransferase [Accumulibacter sp.]